MQSFQIPSTLSLTKFKAKALAWAKAQSTPLCYLDNNAHQNNPYHRYEMILGVGAKASLQVNEIEKAWDQLQNFTTKHKGQWLLGYLSYELKDELEKLTSQNPDVLELPKMHFFVPEMTICILPDQQSVEIYGISPKTYWQAILDAPALAGQAPTQVPKIQSRISKEDYLQTIQEIKNHIIEGDIYELNFCQEFFAKACEIDPLSLYWRMNQLTQTPFSCYYQTAQHQLLSASPERFLYKAGQKLVSQPIKGTIARGNTPEEDRLLQAELLASEKDRAENVMIVDLVRNDLAKISEIGSVAVEELFGIYGFNQVSQMISTIVGELKGEESSLGAIKAAFPMGSMTGAPKVISMKLIEALESRKRGLYSGAVGYFNPAGDFDFNVVIRSLLYNKAKQYLSFQVGGAIVYDSDPMLEYEECLLKAKGMLLALGIN